MEKSKKINFLPFRAPKYPGLSLAAITRRLEDHLSCLRMPRLISVEKKITDLVEGLGMSVEDAGEVVYATLSEIDRQLIFVDARSEEHPISSKDSARISRRAKRIYDLRRHTIPDLRWLQNESKADAIYKASRDVDLQGVVTPDESDEAIARIHAEMPWMAPITSRVMKCMRARARRDEAFHMPPILLVGPPGVGKSTVFRKISDAYGVASVQIDAGGSGGGVFALTGAERGWGSAHAGLIVKKMLEKRVANPIVIVDELDKGGLEAKTHKGSSIPGLHSALLAMLEPETARRWRCSYYGIEFDLTHITWIFTANTEWGLPDALRSRLTILRIDGIRPHDVQTITRQLAAGRLEPEIADFVAENLARRAAYSTVDLRLILRHIAKAEEIQTDKEPLH